MPTARTVAVTTPDLLATEAVIRNARALNPAIHVIVRAPGTGDVSGLSARGADEVVQPEFEAGLEFVRQVLGWQGIDCGSDRRSGEREAANGLWDQGT